MGIFFLRFRNVSKLGTKKFCIVHKPFLLIGSIKRSIDYSYWQIINAIFIKDFHINSNAYVFIMFLAKVLFRPKICRNRPNSRDEKLSDERGLVLYYVFFIEIFSCSSTHVNTHLNLISRKNINFHGVRFLLT